MKVMRILQRVFVDPNDLERTIGFYSRVFDQRTFRHFKHEERDLEIVQVGPVLIIAGLSHKLRAVQFTNFTYLVDSVDEFRMFLNSEEAEILEGPNRVPTGVNMRVRHPDGVIVEYVEHQPGSLIE